MSTPTTPMNADEKKAFDVFLAAVDRYLASVDETEGQAFEAWLDTHAEEAELLPLLLQTYPKFGEFFAEEVEKLAATNSNQQ